MILSDGFININKEPGCSSHHVVATIRRLFHCKAGHCGTLDPAATGVLPIAIGKATRLSEYVMGQHKTYVGEVCFGFTTDSYDGAGTRLSECDASFVSAAAVEDLLPNFCGPILQAPPAVSAIKRDGEPLYKKVRRGESVETLPRAVVIYNISLLDFCPDGGHPRCRLEISCGQGAYIRSIAHDLGQLLGCGAYLSALQRMSVGSFTLADSYTSDQIAALAEQGCYDFLVDPNDALSHIVSISVKEDQLFRIVHGNDLLLDEVQANNAPPDDEPTRVLDEGGRLLGVGSVSRLQLPREGCLLQMNKVLVDADDYAALRTKMNCAIGNFDGLHLGHRALMERLHQYKQSNGGISAVLTFDPHPLTLISGRAPELLTEKNLKQSLLRQYFGIDDVITLPFDRTMIDMPSEQFADRILVERLHATNVVVGYNFTYGQNGNGDSSLLTQHGHERGFNVSVIEAVQSVYGSISSSRIRDYLRHGNMAAVNEMLGYWFVIEGRVVSGSRLGRTIGFPTANIYPAPGQAMPPVGVYACRVEHDGKTFSGVANYGVKPTIEGQRQPLVEAHIFGCNDNLYDEIIRVWFCRFIRPEMRFTGLTELTEQITADSQTARKILEDFAPNQHLPNKIL